MADPPVEATSWGALDDRCVSQIADRLDARTLVNLSQVDRRCKNISRTCWRHALEEDFPFHYRQQQQQQRQQQQRGQQQRGGGGSAPLDWLGMYRQRTLHERNWDRGQTSAPSETLRCHMGPILGATFLQDPFPGRLALSAGVAGQQETSEITLWDLDCRMEELEFLGRLGWQLGGGAQDELCGVFDARQRPGMQQVVLCGFSSEVHVAAIKQQPLDLDTLALCDDKGAGEGPLGEGAPGSEGVRLSRLLGQRSGHTNLKHMPDWAAVEALRPSLQRGWQLRTLYSLPGHEAACPTARFGGGALVTATFDGTLKLWRLPQEGQEPGACGEEGGSDPTPQQPAYLTPAATFEDPAVMLDPSTLHNRAVCAVALGTDCSRMVSGGNDMVLREWDVESGRVLQRLMGNQGWVWNLETLGGGPHPDTVLSGATDSTLRVWDLRAGRQAASTSLSDHYGGNVYPVGGLCLRPDERWAVAGCFDGMVYVVDLRMLGAGASPASHIHTLSGHTDRVTRVSCGGDDILSGGFDGNVRLWHF